MNNDTTETFSSYVRSLRQDRSLTLGELSRRAGVNRATLSRWESGAYFPRIPELLQVLDALQASPAARTRGLSLLDAPRAIHTQRNDGAAPTLRASLGDLLYSLRQRAGRTQSEVARAVGVSRSLVSQWENDMNRPAASQLHAVGYALGASADEIAVLSTRSFARAPLEKTREALLERYKNTMYWDAGMTETSYKLHLLTLLGGFGRLRRAGKAHAGDLALIVSNFGDCALVWDNDLELRNRYHRRALALAAESDSPVHFHLASAVRSLLDPHSGMGPFKERVSAALAWRDRFRSKAGQAYLLSFIAGALAEEAPEEALRLGEQYRALVADEPDEYPCRLHDWGNLLLKCGRAAESVAFFSTLHAPDRYREGLYRLTMARGLKALGSITESSHCLREAKNILSVIDSPSMQTLIHALERAIDERRPPECP